MNLRILYHGHCFDGVASAATFTRFYKERINPEAEVHYTGLLHRPGNLFDLAMFDSDENAIVDFKYCADERLTWWFDHHQSAFLSKEDERHFLADASGKKFLDIDSKSCAEFIARVARERFDFEDTSMAELIEWAHIIDGALYESPAQCVELRSSAEHRAILFIYFHHKPAHGSAIIGWELGQAAHRLSQSPLVSKRKVIAQGIQVCQNGIAVARRVLQTRPKQ